MPTNLTYKGRKIIWANGRDFIISTVNKNQSKTMKTQGKYLEGDVIVTNVANDEAKSVSFTPSSSSQTQTITPSSGYESLSSVTVTVNPIPSSYIIPSGTLTITAAGTTDVTNYAAVTVPEGEFYGQVVIPADLTGGTSTVQWAVDSTTGLVEVSKEMLKENVKVEGTGEVL